MSEMVERVANAIGSHISNRDRTLTPWTMIAARAAIAAMREPTGQMTGHGGEAIREFLDGDFEENAPEVLASVVWRTMIDVSLGEKP